MNDLLSYGMALLQLTQKERNPPAATSPTLSPLRGWRLDVWYRAPSSSGPRQNGQFMQGRLPHVHADPGPVRDGDDAGEGLQLVTN